MRETHESQQVRRIADYIKKNVSKGYTPESLKWALINQKYSRFEVEKGITLATKELSEQAPKLKEKPVIKYEAFENDEPIKVQEKRSWFKWLLGLD